MKNLLVAVILILISFESVQSRTKSHAIRRGNHAVSSKHGVSNRYQETHVVRDGPGEDSRAVKAAALGRYIVHNSDWLTIATQGVSDPHTGYAFANIKSFADGTKDKSTGIPYFYMTPLDETAKGLEKDNRAGLIITMQQDGYCSKNGYDPEDPECGRIFIQGRVFKLENGTEEFDFAKEALFEKHPHMKTWPENHHFFFSKLVPEILSVEDGKGGPKGVPVDLYFKTAPLTGPEH